MRASSVAAARQALSACAAIAALLPAALLPGAAGAQEAGRATSLTLSQSLFATSNAGLVPGGEDVTTQSLTRAALSWRSATHGQSFAAGLSANLRGVADAGGSPTFTVDNPRLTLGYALSTPGAGLELGGSASLAEVAYIRTLEEFLLENGAFPEDLGQLQGEGQRRNLDASFALSLRDDAPFGLSLSGRLHDVAYLDVSDPDLVDSTRATLGLGARMTLSPVAELRLDLTRESLRSEGADEVVRLGLGAGLDIARPNGTFGLEAAVTDTGAGEQYALSVSRGYHLPEGAELSGSLGVTLRADDSLTATGALHYRRPGPQSLFSLDAARRVTFDAANEDVVQTSLALGLDHAVTPLLSASLDAGFVRAEDAAGVTDLADLSAGLSYALAPETSLSAEAGWQWRDDADGTAGSLSLSLTLSREWATRR